MLSVSSGHSARYLTDAVGAGMESYYTGACNGGEPPGVWSGAGAATLGLAGEVDPDVMHAVYGRFADPRDEPFADESTRHEAATLGRAPKQFRTPEEVVSARVEAHPGTPSPGAGTAVADPGRAGCTQGGDVPRPDVSPVKSGHRAAHGVLAGPVRGRRGR